MVKFGIEEGEEDDLFHMDPSTKRLRIREIINDYDIPDDVAMRKVVTYFEMRIEGGRYVCPNCGFLIMPLLQLETDIREILENLRKRRQNTINETMNAIDHMFGEESQLMALSDIILRFLKRFGVWIFGYWQTITSIPKEAVDSLIKESNLYREALKRLLTRRIAVDLVHHDKITEITERLDSCMFDALGICEHIMSIIDERTEEAY